MDKKIAVTADDICRGARGSPIGCPIARALNRTTGLEADVGPNAFWLNDDVGVVRRYELPQEAQAFIRAFDAGDPVGPFEFEPLTE